MRKVKNIIMAPTKLCLMLLIIGTTLIVSSCWDGIEINRRSVIFSIGIDKNMEETIGTDSGMDDPRRYAVSYVIPDMGKLTGAVSVAEDIVSVETAKSTTFSSTIEDVQTKTQNTINFGHTKAILLGADLLRDPIMMAEVIDALERNMLFSRSTPIFAVRATAQEVLEVKNEQHPMIGLYIMNYIQNKERAVSRYKEALLGNTIRDLRENNAAVIPIVDTIYGKKIEIKGGALLKGFELQGWFTPEEVRGILWAEGKVRGAKIPVPFGESYLSYTVREQESKIRFFIEDSQLYCNIDITNEGEIGEYFISSSNSLMDEDYIENIEMQVSHKIKKEITHLINQTKQYNTDIIGLRTELYRQHPKLWATLEEGWDKIYQDLQIDVTVDTKVRRTGIIE